jgi:expansin (peptidoglycan-binding protein)
MASGQRGHRHRRPRSRWHLLGLGACGGAAVVAAVLLAVGIGQLAGGQACAAVLSGAAAGGAGSQTATHYVLTSLPNCSYQSPPADGLFVALPAAEYAGAADCGGYLEVSGPDGSVRVKVIDQCPECAAGHIDLSEAAFAKLAPLGAGLINVSYQYLADPPLPAPVTMEVKQGSSQYWLALLADNTGNPLASVQVETSSGGWVNLARANYNYWIAQSGAGSGPFTVRLTDTQGHTVTVRNVALNPGAVQSTGAYMYGAGSTQTAPTPARSSAAPTPTPTPTLTRSSASAAATASASAKPTSSAKSAKPSRSPSAHPSGTGTPAAKRKRAQAPAVPPATVAPTPAPTATPPC